MNLNLNLSYPFSNVSYVLRLPLLVVMLDPQNCLCLLFQVLFLVLPVSCLFWVASNKAEFFKFTFASMSPALGSFILPACTQPWQNFCAVLNLCLYSFPLLDYSILNGFCFLLDAIISLDIPFLAFVYSIILMFSTYLVVPLLFIMKSWLLLRFFFPPMRNLYISVTCIACVCHIVFFFFFSSNIVDFDFPLIWHPTIVFTMLCGLKSLLR